MITYNYPSGATPLNPDDEKGLLLPHITTRAELDRWEQDNINEGDLWAFKYKKKDIISISFIRRLHTKMFNTVWRWAGTFRKNDTNIGVEWYKITEQVTTLCDDTHYWIKESTYDADEIALRFHYRLVTIHPFPNGNGRHARLMSDVILQKLLNKPRFSWGSIMLVQPSDCRARYIKALQAADKGDFSLLRKFVRS